MNSKIIYNKTAPIKSILRWGKIIIMCYFAIGVALYFLQDFFLFHPVAIQRNISWKFDVPFEEMDMVFGKTDTINVVKFLPKNPVRKGVVIYFHGNKENIGRYATFATNFTKHGYEVWMEDYPGFGKSIGERNEAILYQQALQLYQLAAAKYHADSIIIFGKSFGTGIAAYLASERKAKQLILETPYYSIPALFNTYAPIYPNRYITHYTIPTNIYLQKASYPVTIFHGTNDAVIRYPCAAKLKTVLKPTDQFITIDGGTHHNLNAYPIFHEVLDSLLK